MKYLLFITVVAFSFVGYGQNWDVFNKNYRYNYKYDNSTIISNVLFVDSVKQIGNDTTYYLNRIGVVTGNTLHVNRPQFLMKKLVKHANGDIELLDTLNVLIIPTCSVSQTWTFGTNANLTATCVAISTVNIFNSIDSIRTIVLSNNDSILLCKQYGIIQFPNLSFNNKYYKLVGIENKAAYDSIALVGEKVPNAWDFYKFNAGDKYRFRHEWFHAGTPHQSGCTTSTVVILSRSITPTGYLYFVDQTDKVTSGSASINYFFCHEGGVTWAPWQTNTYTFSTQTYSNLQTSTLVANRMYPGMVIGGADINHPDAYNVVFFDKDNSGNFYKYCGPSQCSSTLTDIPGSNAPKGFAYQTYPPTILTIGFESYSLAFGEGFGMASQRVAYFEFESKSCKTSVVKNGIEYFGQWNIPPNDVGIRENARQELILFPNPANELLQLPVEYGVVKLFDPFGKLVKQEKLENKNTLDISEFTNGVYMIEIQADSFKFSQKLIIQH